MRIVEEYLLSKAIEYKVGPNEQLILRSCPFCQDDKWHCYIGAQNGLIHCKKCCTGSTGNSRGYNFNHLRDKYGDEHVKLETNESIGAIKFYKKMNADIALQYASRLRNTPSILEYLKEKRLLKEEVIKEYLLGWTGDFISFPLYENGVLANIIYRYNPLVEKPDNVPRYKTEAGARPILFNVDRLKLKPKRILITEGILDALVLASLGNKDILSVPMGAGYFNKEWVELFEGVQEIYTCFDNDEVGQKGVEQISELLGADRCKNIILPKSVNGNSVKDITDFFKAGGTEKEFLQCIMRASQKETGDVRSLGGFKDEFIDYLKRGSGTGYYSGLEDFDNLLGGFRKGHLTLVSGLPGSGKTSFSQGAAYHMSAYQKVPSLFFSLEMTPVDIVKRYVTLISDIKGEDMSRAMTDEELGVLGVVFEIFKEVPLYLYVGEATLTIETLKELIVKSIKEKGIEIVFIDHLHYFSQSTAHKSAEIGNLVRGIRNIARDLNIPVVLLCHLNRSGRSQQKTGLYIPSLSDLKDSSGLEQDASEVVFVCRDADNDLQTERQKVFFKVAKNRDGQVGIVQAKFNESKLTFESVPQAEITVSEPRSNVNIDF